MPVVDYTVLKEYFQNGKVPHQDNYVDLVDTLGAWEGHNHDSDYHRKDQNILNNNGLRIGSSIVTPAAGVGYFQDYLIAMGGLYAGSNTDPGTGIIRSTQAIRSGTYLEAGTYVDAGSYINSADEYRINNVGAGLLQMYSTGNFKTNASWDGSTTHVAGVYTFTPAVWGYPSNSKALYVHLGGRVSTSGSGYLGINDASASSDYPLFLNTDTNFKLTYGIIHLNGSGEFILRIGTATHYVKIQIWGAFR